MNLTATIDDISYKVDLSQGYSLAIPLMFDGTQPSHFGAPVATMEPMLGGDFIGDTSQGGSCNVPVVKLNPHCNGTHTESIQHICHNSTTINQASIGDLVAAELISMTPVTAKETNEAYQPPLLAGDRVITKSMIETTLRHGLNVDVKALIIRTYPNETEKMGYQYGSEQQPPFFTNEAISFINELGIEHVLVDFPSLDKMYDEGLLSNHHLFWNVQPKSHSMSENSQKHKTVTEMIFVDDSIIDGLYLLNLQIPAFEIDAAPSRPIIYPLEMK